MLSQLDTEWPDVNRFSKLSEHTMQRSSSITPVITLNESSLPGLVRSTVTNNWIVYRIEGAVVVKKAT